MPVYSLHEELNLVLDCICLRNVGEFSYLHSCVELLENVFVAAGAQYAVPNCFRV